jgi:hypothetical protein
LTSKTLPPPAGTVAVWTFSRCCVMSPSIHARSSSVPTTWKSVSKLGPAATTQKRTVSPGFAESGCLTYWPA